MTLSRQWRTVLLPLRDYGTEGIDEAAFVDLIGEGTEAALSQMYFKGMGYWERHPILRKRIRITDEGRKALK